jgi:hypothetical protein
MTVEFESKIMITLDDEFFNDIICTMLEGGSNYWIGRITIQHPDGVKPKGIPNSEWASSALNKGGSVIFVSNDCDPETVELTKDKLISGIKTFVFYKSHAGIITSDVGKCTLDAGNIDAEYADMILQYALFDEIVYG